MICQKCGASNNDSNRFCLQCGHSLDVTGQIALASSGKQLHQSLKNLSNSLMASQEGFRVSGGSIFNIWGPFAGYGTRRRHVGWLMDGQGGRAADLVENVNKGFRKREIPKSVVKRSVLVAQGLWVENRPYFILRRGLTSIGLYITSFGDDLFVSMVSYIKPPISNIRVVFAGLMVVFQLFMSFGFPILLSDTFNDFASGLSLFGGGSMDMTGFLSLLCFIGPLGGLNTLALILLLAYSTYKWIKEKDFLSALRTPPDEFEEDDLMAMEKAVEQTVLSSLDEIGLNSDDLKLASTITQRRLI